jgi:hypothetical protein
VTRARAALGAGSLIAVAARSALAAAALLALAAPGARALDAEAVKARWMQRLDGRAFTAKVAVRVRHRDIDESRHMEVWRDDKAGLERLMARFDAPPEIRGLGILYLEQSGRSNDYFVYQPATKRTRRVPEAMVREDVYGVDLEYLGFGVAQLEPTRVESVAEAVLDDRPAIRLEEHAERSGSRFDRRVVWLHPEMFVPLRTEHYRGEQLVLVAVTERIDTVQGVETPRRVRFERPVDHQIVEMEVEAVDYVARIPEAFFTTMRLVHQSR